MRLEEMDFDGQVRYLRSLLRSGKGRLTSYIALFAFRHHLASKHAPGFSQKPVLRWYLGQLAKEYIRRYLDEARANLDNLAQIGLLEPREGKDSRGKEYHLNEAIYPALRDVLEEVFGKDYVSKVILKAKYYRDPGVNKRRGHDQNSEVRE